jgi:hypothetical protein
MTLTVCREAVNHLNTNIKKTEEMLMGSIVNLPPPLLIVQDCCIKTKKMLIGSIVNLPPPLLIVQDCCID